MIEKFRTARLSVRLDVFGVSILIAAIIVSAGFIWVSKPSEPMPTPEDVARAWTESSLESAAGDELVKFIVSISNTMQPELFSQYLNDRLYNSTTWSYAPALDVGNDQYEVVATASTNLHDIIPTVMLDNRVPVGFTQVITMPFHLIVDMESESVIDWSAREDEAFLYSGQSDASPNVVSLEETFGEASAQCIRSARERGVFESVAEILYMPPTIRDESQTRQLRSAISVVGLDAECREWVGD